ncbi:MAG: hypothetical protein IPO81_19955 [Kouleothrix sp.]|nr:hypothetical protein [Kouleothrix sp.]
MVLGIHHDAWIWYCLICRRGAGEPARVPPGRGPGAQRPGDKETRRQGDKETRRQGDKAGGRGRSAPETRRQGDKETRRQRDKAGGPGAQRPGRIGRSPQEEKAGGPGRRAPEEMVYY